MRTSNCFNFQTNLCFLFFPILIRAVLPSEALLTAVYKFATSTYFTHICYTQLIVDRCLVGGTVLSFTRRLVTPASLLRALFGAVNYLICF